jgi:hypothetical protein
MSPPGNDVALQPLGFPSPPECHANYYGAFVLDPDGHNIEAVIHTA